MRRRLAPAKTRGALDPEELSAYHDALERYLDVLELSGEVREAARRISAKGNSGRHAEVMLAWLS